MIITPALIRGVCRLYTVDQLKELVRNAARKLEETDIITSATTGGASYSREERIKISEQIELWEAAIAHLEGGAQDATTQVTPIVCRRPR